MIKFFDFTKAYTEDKEALDNAISKVLSNGDLILRKDVEEFENNLAKFLGVKYVVGLNSCTDALYLALRYLKIGSACGGSADDEVLVPSRTFVATAQVIVQCGAKPVFYDLDHEYELRENTKAIIPVHIEGCISWYFEKLLKRAEKVGIPVIEDAAQALGAKVFRGFNEPSPYAGTLGLAGCFSFYPAKILGASGDAGALVTNDEKMYNWVKEARNHFKTGAEDWGVNSRLDNLQAAILNVRFKNLEENLKRRSEIARMYDKVFEKDPFITIPNPELGRVYQDYIVWVDDRDGLYEFLKDNGVETMKNNYPFPVPKLPLAQEYEDHTLRLPCNQFTTDEEVKEICRLIKKFYE